MNNADLAAHIRKSWTYAKALKIDEVFSGPTGLDASENFRALAMEPKVTYEQLYLAGLQESQYNILLTDFAFLQFGSSSVNSVRFAYYPNPFLGAAPNTVSELNEMREYVAEGVMDLDEFLHRVSEIRRSRHPPLVRYDYSKSQYLETTHPCSHLHLGFHEENRWPLRRHLTANAFTLLIFRLFYLNFWMQADAIKSGERELTMDEVLDEARAECRMLYEDEFSNAEARRFHLI